MKNKSEQYQNRQSQNVLRNLMLRDCGLHTTKSIKKLQQLAEKKFLLKTFKDLKCELPGVPRATFLMVFSPDGTKVASAHVNHKIYITDLRTRKNLRVLTGHPRTPWCIAFHPTSNDILASGCLGGQVRVWDLNGGNEVWKTNTHISSLAFHPVDKLLAIATHNEVHFWDWSNSQPFTSISTKSYKEKVRYVAFDNLGRKLITGIANSPQTSQSDLCAGEHLRTQDRRNAFQRTVGGSRVPIRVQMLNPHVMHLPELYQDNDNRVNNPSSEANNDSNSNSPADIISLVRCTLLRAAVLNPQASARARKAARRLRAQGSIGSLRGITSRRRTETRSESLRSDRERNELQSQSENDATETADQNRLSPISATSTRDEHLPLFPLRNLPENIIRRMEMNQANSLARVQNCQTAISMPNPISPINFQERRANRPIFTKELIIKLYKELADLQSDRSKWTNIERRIHNVYFRNGGAADNTDSLLNSRIYGTEEPTTSAFQPSMFNNEYRIERARNFKKVLLEYYKKHSNVCQIDGQQPSTSASSTSSSDLPTNSQTNSVNDPVPTNDHTYSNASSHNDNSNPLIVDQQSAYVCSLLIDISNTLTKYSSRINELKEGRSVTNNSNTNSSSHDNSDSNKINDEPSTSSSSDPTSSSSTDLRNEKPSMQGLPSPQVTETMDLRFCNIGGTLLVLYNKLQSFLLNQSLLDVNTRCTISSASCNELLERQFEAQRHVRETLNILFENLTHFVEEHNSDCVLNNMDHNKPFFFVHMLPSLGLNVISLLLIWMVKFIRHVPNVESDSSSSAEQLATYNGPRSSNRTNSVSVEVQTASASSTNCSPESANTTTTRNHTRVDNTSNSNQPNHFPGLTRYFLLKHSGAGACTSHSTAEARTRESADLATANTTEPDNNHTSSTNTSRVENANELVRERQRLYGIEARDHRTNGTSSTVRSAVSHVVQNISYHSYYPRMQNDLRNCLALQLIRRLHGIGYDQDTENDNDVEIRDPQQYIRMNYLGVQTYRIQAWDFSSIPEINDPNKNVIVRECSIINDASIDISSDGAVLATVLPTKRFNLEQCIGVYSLQWDTLGDQLYSCQIANTVVSVSLSPTGHHLLVGLASHSISMAYIYKLLEPEEKVLPEDLLLNIYNVHPLATRVYNKERPSKMGMVLLRQITNCWDSGSVTLNCIRWAPQPGQGLVYATNTGLLKILF